MPSEIDPLINSFRHLQQFQRQDEALHTLKRIASMVKPIMRARQWRVGELCEFYPDQHNLLGLNENRGQRILIRLRYAGDRNQFLPFESVVDTMLHELCHNVHGPHDQKFHALWDQLREELDGLMMKGYTGEGFLSKGHHLGGHRIPQHERLRQARAEAVRNKPPPPQNPGHRLGGSRPRPGEDIRSVIVRSVERRNMGDQNCANQNKNDKEIEQISEQWRRNGFRTQAEEEAANEAAIAQALWELVQEDQKREYGDRYIPPSSQNPAGNRGAPSREAIRSSQITEYYAPQASSSSSSRAPPPPPVPNATRPPPVPTAMRPPPPPPPPPPAAPTNNATNNNFWICNICTLQNQLAATECEVCLAPGPVIRRPHQPGNNREVIDLTSSPSRSSSSAAAASTSSSLRPQPAQGNGSSRRSYQPPPPPLPPQQPNRISRGPAYWACSFCSNVMEVSGGPARLVEK